MKRAYIGFCTLLVAVLLAGCDQLTHYTVSEQAINHSLQKHNNYGKDLGIPGVATAHFTLSELISAIGREEPNKVTLSANVNVEMSSLLGPQQAMMKIKMKTAPFFDKEQGAIYLRDIEIVSADIQPEKMDTLVKALTPYLNQSLKTYFDNKPAYILSEEHSKKELLAKKLAKGLEVKPGELMISLAD